MDSIRPGDRTFLHHQRRLDETLIDWLAQHRHRIFLTVTLKKSIVDSDTQTHIRLIDEQAIRIAKILRNNITTRLVGRRGRLNFSTFKEVGLFDERPHLHILFDNPNGVPFRIIKSIVASIIEESQWTHRQWDIRPIHTQHSLLAYTLKQGLSAYLPEASWHPTEALR